MQTPRKDPQIEGWSILSQGCRPSICICAWTTQDQLFLPRGWPTTLSAGGLRGWSWDSMCGQASSHSWGGKSWGPSVDQGRGPSGLVSSCSHRVHTGFCSDTLLFVLWALTFLLRTCRAGLGIPGPLARWHLDDPFLLISRIVSQRLPILHQKGPWLSIILSLEACASCPFLLQLPEFSPPCWPFFTKKYVC